MLFRRAVALAVAALVLAATPSLADMIIKLRNGQVITVPVQPGNIESLSFTGSAVPAPAAASPAVAAPISLTPASTAATASVPAESDGGGAHPPPNALVFPPMRPDHPSGRVLHVGPSRELKVPSQAAKEARNGDIVEIDAADYRGDVAVWNQNDIVIRGVGAAGRISMPTATRRRARRSG
jgi:hypothetical protein